MVHFGQIWKHARFARYDYGRASLNRAAYNQSGAPLYPLANIPANYTVVLIYGKTDLYIVEHDVQKLIHNLQLLNLNVVNHQVASETWNHCDFLIGKNAASLVNDPTLAYLDQYMK